MFPPEGDQGHLSHPNPLFSGKWAISSRRAAREIAACPPRRAVLVQVGLPQVWPEHLVLDVLWCDTPFEQPAADGLHERQRTAEVVERIIGRLDGREIHEALVHACHRL